MRSEFLESEDIKGVVAENIIHAEDKKLGVGAAKRRSFIYEAGENIHATNVLLQKRRLFIPEDLHNRFKVFILDLGEVRSEQYLVMIGRIWRPRSYKKVPSSWWDIAARRGSSSYATLRKRS